MARLEGFWYLCCCPFKRGKSLSAQPWDGATTARRFHEMLLGKGLAGLVCDDLPALPSEASSALAPYEGILMCKVHFKQTVVLPFMCVCVCQQAGESVLTQLTFLHAHAHAHAQACTRTPAQACTRREIFNLLSLKSNCLSSIVFPLKQLRFNQGG